MSSFMVDFYDEVEEEVEEERVIKQENGIKCEFCNLKVEENEFEGHICFTIDQTIIQEEKIELANDVCTPHCPVNLVPPCTDEAEKFKDEKCQLKFKSEDTLKQHLSSEHPKTKSFNCAKCDYKGKNNTELKMHVIRKHLNPDEIKWFKCEKCDYKCKIKQSLKRHNIYKHLNSDEINWFKCEICDYKSKDTGDLKKHINSMHGPNSRKLKWFMCKNCNFKSRANTKLKEHLHTFRHGKKGLVRRLQLQLL